MIELDLRDIHLPDGLPWWPLAPGWWLLLLVLAMLSVLSWWYWRRHRNPLRRASLRELARLRDAHSAGADAPQILADVSMLLRRIAISRLGRTQVAGLTGEHWQACLAAMSPGEKFDAAQLDLLTHRRFRQNPDCDVDQLLRVCERWIRSLPRDGRHVSA